MTISFAKAHLCLAILLLSFPVWAKDPEIKPVLDPTTFNFDGLSDRARLLRLFNNEDFAVEWSASTYSWEQEDGKDRLTSSPDVIVEPSLIRLPPHSGGEVSIRYAGAFSDRERALRILMTENVLKETSLTIKYTHSLPVFIAPTSPLKLFRLSLLRKADGMLAVHISNDGHQHGFVKDIKVTGWDAQGGKVFGTDRAGWYLLAGNEVAYRVTVSTADCKNTVQFNADVDLKDGSQLKANLGSLICAENTVASTGFEREASSITKPIDASGSE